MALKYILLFISFALGVYSLKLPNYVDRCKFDDPGFEECAKKSAENILQNIANGDRSFNIPSLSPLKLPLINLAQGDKFHMELTDIDVEGLEKAQFSDVNFKKQSLNLKFHVDKIILIGRYKVNGKILVVPIQGDGRFNVTTVGGDFTYSVKLDTIDKKGETYFKLLKDEEHHKFTRVYFQFDNLFNGDPKLGPQINMWLNENWEDVLVFLDQTLSTAIGAVFRLMVNAFLTQKPQNQLFLE